jgi:hypothetical protein
MNTSLQAAGKVLSTNNAVRLKQVFSLIAEILLSADIIDAEKLEALIPEDETPGEAEGVAASTESQPIEAEAEDFKTQVQRVTWHDRFKSVIKIFVNRFQCLHDDSEQSLTIEMGVDVAKNRVKAIAALIDDLKAVLTELSADHPGATEDSTARWQGMEAPYLYLSAGQEQQEVNHLSLTFDCPVQASSKTKRKNNRHPVSGVLFRIDEPSEAVPSKGPGLPLYIPQDVAASILNNVSGLPLDAADNLSEHADENITGVMLSAEIQEKDFVVHGFLFEASRPDKVEAIAANRDTLGMSMTADAWGHEAEVSGRKVFWVDSIDLKGANILYSDRATYQQTRLIAAEKFDPANRDPTPTDSTAQPPVATQANQKPVSVAAATTPQDQPSIPTGQEPMTLDPALQQQLTDISGTLGTLRSDVTKDITSLADSVKLLAETVQTVQASVQTIESERQQNIQQVAAAQRQQQETEQRNALVTDVAAAVAKMLNPSGQPARRTVPLATQTETEVNAASMNGLQLELVKAQSALDALRTGGGDRTKRMELVQKISNLKVQLGIA